MFKLSRRGLPNGIFRSLGGSRMGGRLGAPVSLCVCLAVCSLPGGTPKTTLAILFVCLVPGGSPRVAGDQSWPTDGPTVVASIFPQF